MNDNLQLCSNTTYDYDASDETRAIRDWREEVRLMRRLVDRVNSMQPPPRFLVVCGDLIDAMPGVAYRGEQIRDFKVRLYFLQDWTRRLLAGSAHAPQPRHHARVRVWKS